MRVAGRILTAAAGYLAVLSRDRTGETERKPGGKGLKANRMIYWLDRKKGGLVTGERWQDYTPGSGQLRESQSGIERLSVITSLLSSPGPSGGSSSFLKAPFLSAVLFSDAEPSPTHFTKSTGHPRHGWCCETGGKKAAIKREMVSAQMEPGNKWRKTSTKASQQHDKRNEGLLGLIRVVIDRTVQSFPSVRFLKATLGQCP